MSGKGHHMLCLCGWCIPVGAMTPAPAPYNSKYIALASNKIRTRAQVIANCKSTDPSCGHCARLRSGKHQIERELLEFIS